MVGKSAIPSAHHSVPSPNGAFIATVQRSSLVVHSASTASPPQTWSLPAEFVSSCKYIRWSRGRDVPNTKTEGGRDADGRLGYCILLADDDSIRVFDISDPTWRAKINGVATNLGKIASVVFGHTPNDIVVFSDFGAKVTIWSLLTSRGIEIKDPKYMAMCYDFRPRTGHLALVIRPNAQDTLMILKPGSSEVVRSVELASHDLQEVKWSPDGNWLAVRDTARLGPEVLVYTSDGHLFRTYSRAYDEDHIGLGVKCIQWSPAGLLTVGDHDGVVTILSKNIFSPLLYFHHPTIIDMPDVIVWDEQINAARVRSYARVTQPANPPSVNSFAKKSVPEHGVSLIAYNPGGSLFATRNDSIPSTAWIWSLETGKAIAVLIHHFPIKQLAWHPFVSDLLLVQCAISEPTIHLWRRSWDILKAVTLPLDSANGRLEAGWLHNRSEDLMSLAISSVHQLITAELSADGEVIQGPASTDNENNPAETGPEQMFDEGNSLDLSPIKLSHETLEVNSYEDPDTGLGMTGEVIDDTFQYRQFVKATG